MLFLKMVLSQIKHTLKKEKKLMKKYLEQKAKNFLKRIYLDWNHEIKILKLTNRNALKIKK